MTESSLSPQSHRFSQEVLRILAEAGWRPGRDVETELEKPADFTIFPAAQEALREFGNLKVGSPGSGVEWERVSVDLDPGLAEGRRDVFVRAARACGKREMLYPLGKIPELDFFLGMDPQGRVFAFSDSDNDSEKYWYIASSFDRALERLLSGILWWPLDTFY